MEGKGMLMYNRVTSEPSHTMWVIKPANSRRWSIIEKLQPSPTSSTGRAEEKQQLESNAMDESLKETMGGGRNRSFSEPPYSKDLTSLPSPEEAAPGENRDHEYISPNTLMSLPPVLCHVCERWVVAAFFEQHSELCIEIHRTEMDVNICNDSLRDLRHHILELSDGTKAELEQEENNTKPGDKAQDVSTEKQQQQQQEGGGGENDDGERDSIFGEEKMPLEEEMSEKDKKRADLKVYADLVEILDVALSISMPGRYDEEENEMDQEEQEENGKCRSLQSPRSKTKMVQILYWRPPAADNSNTTSLVREVEKAARAKVDAVNRMRDRLEYNERARNDFQKTMQQDADWSEFVCAKDDTCPPESSNKQSQQQQQQQQQQLQPQQQQQKKGLLSRLRSWKTKGVEKLSRRQRRKTQSNSSNMPLPSKEPGSIVEAEIIDTPVGSPGLRPQRSKDLSSSSSPSAAASGSTGKSPLSPLQAFIPGRPTPPSIKDFDIIKPISKGAFGSVFLAKKRATGDYYAIKFLKKSDMIAKNQVTNVKAERMILMTQTDSPFVTKLYYTFQSKDYLYLVLEYLNGGDCSALVKVLGSLPEDWARNYLAEVTLGLAYLHDRNIIHRQVDDLASFKGKP